MNFSIRVAAGLVLVAGSGTSFAQGLSLAQAVTMASRDAPGLVANVEQIEAARLSAVPAGALPDPKLLLGMDNLPVAGADAFHASRDFMTMQRIGVMQEFPNRASRHARTAGAQGRVAVAQAQYGVARLNAMRLTAVAWIARDTAERQLARIDSLEAENRLFDAAVRARLQGGQGAASEAVAARQEAALIIERREQLQARRAGAVAVLRQWIGDAAATMTLTGTAPDWPMDREELLQSVQRHPQFALFDSQAQVLDADVAQARAAKRPDWSLEVAYQKRGPQFSNMMSLQVSVDLPVRAGSRQDPVLAARLAERRALAADRDAGIREHAQMLETGLAEYERLCSASARQRDVVVPLAAEKVELAMADWRSGKLSVVEVISARRDRIEAGLRQIELEGERQLVAAELQYTYAEHAGEQP